MHNKTQLYWLLARFLLASIIVSIMLFVAGFRGAQLAQTIAMTVVIVAIFTVLPQVVKLWRKR